MKEALSALLTGLSNQVTRAKLLLSGYSLTKTRTLVQAQGMAREVLQNLELMLPYGRSALPGGTTADLVVIQVNNNRDHALALACDDPALRILDLQLGEFGDRDVRGQQIVYRLGWLELTTPNFFALASAAAPTANPPLGTFYLFVDPADHKLKARGSSGTISTLATP